MCSFAQSERSFFSAPSGRSAPAHSSAASKIASRGMFFSSRNIASCATVVLSGRPIRPSRAKTIRVNSRSAFCRSSATSVTRFSFISVRRSLRIAKVGEATSVIRALAARIVSASKPSPPVQRSYSAISSTVGGRRLFQRRSTSAAPCFLTRQSATYCSASDCVLMPLRLHSCATVRI